MVMVHIQRYVSDAKSLVSPCYRATSVLSSNVSVLLTIRSYHNYMSSYGGWERGLRISHSSNEGDPTADGGARAVREKKKR